MLKPVYILAFSGHRALRDGEALRDGIRVALGAYRLEAERLGGVLHLHCSIAYGADLLVLEEAESLGIPVHLILPKHYKPVEPGKLIEGLAADFVDPATGVFRQSDWERALRAMRNAESGRNSGSVRTVLPESPDPECYYDAGVRMLSVADGLLAIWDGLPARGLGGSAEICDHARMLGIPVWVLSPEPANAGQDSRPDDGLLLARGGELAMSLFSITHGSSADIFRQLDASAGALGSSFRVRMTAAIRLHFYATLLAAFAASVVTVPWAKYALIAFAAIEGVLVTAAWWIQRLDHRGKTQSRWLDLRFAAELVRSARATRDLVDPIYPCVQKHRPEWARFVRTISLELRKEKHGTVGSWTEHRAVYVRERLEEQALYFETRQKQASVQSARTRDLAAIATDLAPWVVGGALLLKASEKLGWLVYVERLAEGFLVPEMLRFLPIALPLIAGYLGSIRQASDAGRRAIRYSELAVQLRSIAKVIIHLRTHASVSHAVVQAEEVLLSEQLEWRLRESQVGYH